jgi:hypothetical protein
VGWGAGPQAVRRARRRTAGKNRIGCDAITPALF